MGRLLNYAAALAAGGALALAGCGGAAPSTDSTTLHVGPKAQAQTGPTAVERTDGRLGDATTISAGSPLRRLSPGGRPDVGKREQAPRRDAIGAGDSCANTALMPAPENVAAMSAATLCLLNGIRVDHGLAPLASNPHLVTAATAYAQDLIAGSYFSHTGRDGSSVFDRVKAAGYIPPGAGWSLGENLAWGTGSLATPASIMQAWMNSPGHRENILFPDYREIGVGIALGNPAQPDGLGATYATDFGLLDGGDVIEPEPDATAPDPASDPAPTGTHKRKHARRHRRARARARAARRARARAAARRHGQGRGMAHRRRGSRGPKAHIAM